MRLINAHTYELRQFVVKSHIPPYTILSHTWEDEEVTFAAYKDHGSRHKLRGWQKVRKSCELAISDGFDWTWIDTCCIDSSSSTEVAEAINAMGEWYYLSGKCYAYLCDVAVESTSKASDQYEFQESRWFKRGWTLQELLAPSKVDFLNREWNKIGDKDSLRNAISEGTGINRSALEDLYAVRKFSVAARLSWASFRETTREEDQAYCLMGLFDVSMPLFYGEGRQKAFYRLQQEIIRQFDDETIFAWNFNNPHRNLCHGLLAPSLKYFRTCGDIVTARICDRPVFQMTNKGLQINLALSDPIFSHAEFKIYCSVLNCKRVLGWGPLVLFIAAMAKNRSVEYCRIVGLTELSDTCPSEKANAPQRAIYIRQLRRVLPTAHLDWSELEEKCEASFGMNDDL